MERYVTSYKYAIFVRIDSVEYTTVDKPTRGKNIKIGGHFILYCKRGKTSFACIGVVGQRHEQACRTNTHNSYIVVGIASVMPAVFVL
jgi:hypothetical protein